MAELQLSVKGNHVVLSGDVVYETVLFAVNASVFSADSPRGKTILFDFVDVDRADSSGLAIMVHWLREAKKRGLEVEFRRIPKKLFALAEMSNLDGILPISSS